MIASGLKLESFVEGRDRGRPSEAFSRAALEQARATGFEEGRAAGRSADAAMLREAIADLVAAMAEDQQRRDAMRQEAVAALAPVLHELVEALAPAGHSRPMEEALSREFSRLVAQGAPMTCRIACGGPMRPLVEGLARETGLTAFDIIDNGQPDGVVIALQGGQIEFSRQQVAAQIRLLIAEIQEDEQ